MNKNLKKEMPIINDQDLTAVSGGAGRWWEEYGYKPQYSVGQRVRCSCFIDNGIEGYYFDAVGTVKDFDHMNKGAETFIYIVELDTPTPNGEKRHWIPYDRVLGLA